MCLSAQTGAHRYVEPSNAHEATFLSRAQEWMRRAPHELSKAKTWAAKVNAIRPLCEQRVAVEPTAVAQHMLEHGHLEMRDGKLSLTQEAFDAGEQGLCYGLCRRQSYHSTLPRVRLVCSPHADVARVKQRLARGGHIALTDLDVCEISLASMSIRFGGDGSRDGGRGGGRLSGRKQAGASAGGAGRRVLVPQWQCSAAGCQPFSSLQKRTPCKRRQFRNFR